MSNAISLAVCGLSLLSVMTAETMPDVILSRAPHRDPRQWAQGLLRPTAPAFQAQSNAQQLVIRSLDGESRREIPRTGESNNVPMWSPDGKSIAFQVRQNGRNVIAVVQSD